MVKKTQVKLTLSNGKTSVINLPQFIGSNLQPFTDPNTGSAPAPADHNAILAAFATDDGATVNNIELLAISTDTLDNLPWTNEIA